MIQNIRPEEVTSVKVIDYPKNFRQLYAEALATFPPEGRIPGSIIAIYTRPGKGLFGAIKKTNKLNSKSIPILSVEKKIYAPKYTSEGSFYTKEPDLRSTVYWNPNVTTTNDGKSSIRYYHSDNEGDFTVVIESITKDGRIGYKTISYSVSDTNN